ncbi:MAG: peptidyl-prolyl cis-trans isomerase [Planctomycetes bacterium]|nr:peptidyl-prolyl cis-trans isomerase [Planctomycetota bacterium]MBI3843117.1 peptidyl-prolyl cis-trans isomerase [Planctomycetota bacterium]
MVVLLSRACILGIVLGLPPAARPQTDGNRPATALDATRSDGERVDGFVAQVNKHLITRRDVDQRVGSLRVLADPEKAPVIWRQQLMVIIREHLETDAAKEIGIHVDPKSVEHEMKKSIEKAGGRETFLNVLERDGKTEAQYREDLENDLLRIKYITTTSGIYTDADKKVRPEVDIEPSVAELRAYYSGHIAEFTVLAKAHVRQIYLRNAKFASEDEARARMVELRERILKGEAFADVAKAESHDSSSRDAGGDIGEIPLEGGPYQKFLTTFAAAAKPGELSEIEQVPYGWYLFKLEGKTDTRVRSFDEPKVQEEIVARLKDKKLTDHLAAMNDRLLKEAYIYCPEIPELNRGSK